MIDIIVVVWGGLEWYCAIQPLFPRHNSQSDQIIHQAHQAHVPPNKIIIHTTQTITIPHLFISYSPINFTPRRAVGETSSLSQTSHKREAGTRRHDEHDHHVGTAMDVPDGTLHNAINPIFDCSLLAFPGLFYSNNPPLTVIIN